jgi:hypothetical protein
MVTAKRASVMIEFMVIATVAIISQRKRSHSIAFKLKASVTGQLAMMECQIYLLDYFSATIVPIVRALEIPGSRIPSY